MTFLHPSFPGTITCHGLPLESLQEVQHNILILVVIHSVLNHACVDTIKTFDIYDEQSTTFGLQWGVVYCCMCNN